MDDVRVRPAAAADVEEVARLVSQLGYPSEPPEMAGRLEQLLRRADYHTLVAEISGQVVGLAGACTGHSLHFDGVYGRLTGLVVDEAYRGRGVGTLLMKAIERWLEAEGAVRLVVTSAKHRTEAHEFYRTLGYEETGIRFVKQLSTM